MSPFDRVRWRAARSATAPRPRCARSGRSWSRPATSRWVTASQLHPPMENPYCSCKPTRVWPHGSQLQPLMENPYCSCELTRVRPHQDALRLAARGLPAADGGRAALLRHALRRAFAAGEAVILLAPRSPFHIETPAKSTGGAIKCRREFCHFTDNPLSIPVEAPTEGRGGCSGMTASPTARRRLLRDGPFERPGDSTAYSCTPPCGLSHAAAVSPLAAAAGRDAGRDRLAALRPAGDQTAHRTVHAAIIDYCQW